MAQNTSISEAATKPTTFGERGTNRQTPNGRGASSAGTGSATSSQTTSSEGSNSSTKMGAEKDPQGLDAKRMLRDAYIARERKRVSFGAHATPSKERGQVAAAVEEKEVEQPEQVDDQQSSAASDVTDPTDTRYERARAALLRVGEKADAIAKMDKADVIRRGLKAKRILDRAASKEAENQALRKQLNTAREGGSSTATVNDGPQSRVPPSLADFGKPAEPLKKYLDSLPDEDKAEAIAATSPLLAELAQARAAIERSQANGSEGSDADLMAKARAKLTERIPDLADDDEFQDVLKEASAIAGSRVYQDAATRSEKWERVISDAAQRLDLEFVGEHEQPIVPQGAARRGMLDVSHVNGAAARGQQKELTPEQAKEQAIARFEARQAQRTPNRR